MIYIILWMLIELTTTIIVIANLVSKSILNSQLVNRENSQFDPLCNIKPAEKSAPAYHPSSLSVDTILIPHSSFVYVQKFWSKV